MSLKNLAESIDSIREAVLIESAKEKGDSYGDAASFFKSGVQPDGGRWKDRIIPKLGFDNIPVIKRAKKKKTKDGMIYTASLSLSPGKGGGGGVGIDPVASNHLFNLLGTDKKTIIGVSRAYKEFAQKSSRKLSDALRRWLMVPENFLHNIVGWKDRDNFTIGDVSFKKIVYKDPMVDTTRRKWPAGRTEIWMPMEADVVIEVRKKG